MSTNNPSAERSAPASDLDEVAAAFLAGRYEVTARVRRHIRRKGWTREQLETCVVGLVASDFHKSQQHLEREDVWLDIYRPWIAGTRRYVKFVWDAEVEAFVVLSFCIDGEAH